MLEIIIIPAKKDNYIHILHDNEKNITAVVDPTEAYPVIEELEKRGWWLDVILNTHHHGDHVGGNLKLHDKYQCKIYGYIGDLHRIPGMNVYLYDEDIVNIGVHKAKVLFIPGHTLGHIAYWFFEDNVLFTGDTLFAIGCGRIFEGTMEQLFKSVKLLSEVPEETKIYVGHEYTENNCKFALKIEPNNQALQERHSKILELRAKNLPTLPTTMKDELATNPFLRLSSQEIRKNLGLLDAPEFEVFEKIRLEKDNF